MFPEKFLRQCDIALFIVCESLVRLGDTVYCPCENPFLFSKNCWISEVSVETKYYHSTNWRLQVCSSEMTMNVRKILTVVFGNFNDRFTLALFTVTTFHISLRWGRRYGSAVQLFKPTNSRTISRHNDLWQKMLSFRQKRKINQDIDALASTFKRARICVMLNVIFLLSSLPNWS